MRGLRPLLAVVTLLVVGCSTGAAASSPGPASATHLSFEALRQRPLKAAQSSTQRCNPTPQRQIQDGTNAVLANGSAPFYFGPWGSRESVGDLNKTPWFIDSSYKGRLVVRGHAIGSHSPVAFGFWPAGYGTPAAQPGVPVAFTRPDQEGRTLVFQDELDIDMPAGGQSQAHYWSFPKAGCYAIQVEGDGFTNVTVVAV